MGARAAMLVCIATVVAFPAVAAAERIVRGVILDGATGEPVVGALVAVGAGEAGTVGAMPVVMNAIVDALAPLGVRSLDMPATPERVWRAIQDARKPK